MLRMILKLAIVAAIGASLYAAFDPTFGPTSGSSDSARQYKLEFVGVVAEGRAIDENPPVLMPLRKTLPGKPRVWALTDDYAYCHDETSQMFLVPSGFVTDLASIPPFARILYNPADYAEAALVHDYLYAIGAPAWRDKSDRIFKQILLETNHSGRRAEVLFRSVRLGGSRGYGRAADWIFWDSDAQDFLKAEPKPKGAVFDDEC